jgi:hypothetical protein
LNAGDRIALRADTASSVSLQIHGVEI